MKESGLLKLLDKFSSIFSRAGVDYGMLRQILKIKLIMDSRRVPTVVAGSVNMKEGKNYFRSSLFIYAFMGTFAALLLLLPFPMFYKMNFSFGLIIFLLMSTMISDFSSVLLDVREKNILVPRPISPKTLSAAKIIHIIYYLFYITAALAGPSLALGTIRFGPVFFILFLIEIILICAFVVFFTSILYTLILKLFDGEKLKDVINYFQIVLSVAVLISYQLIGRIFDISEFVITTSPAWWHYIMPTAWFAAPFCLFLEHEQTMYNIYLSIAALVVPLMSLVIYIRIVMPHFERNLQKLNVQSRKSGNNIKVKAIVNDRISALLCPTSQERLFCRFAQQITGNERKFKLRLYPSLAFAVFMPFVFMLNSLDSDKTLAEFYEGIANGYYHLGLYLTGIMLGSAVLLLGSSENYKGAWIYRALPLESPVPILRGSFKGFFIKYILPVYLLASLLFVIICGTRIIPDILLIFLNTMTMILLIYKLKKKELPFFKDYQYAQDGNTTGIIMMSFFIAGLLGGVHFLVSLTPYGVTVNLAVSMLITVLLWRNSFKITWKDISY